jgi:hypothetical protein
MAEDGADADTGLVRNRDGGCILSAGTRKGTF